MGLQRSGLGGEEGRLPAVGGLETQQLHERASDVSKPGVREVIAEHHAVGQPLAANGDGHGGQGVAGQRQRGGPVVGHERLPGLLVPLHHIVAVAVVAGNQPAPPHLIHRGQQLPHALVHCGARPDNRLQVPGVSHHVGVSIVDADHAELATAEGLVASCRDLSSLHVRQLVEGAVVAGNLDEGLKVLIEEPRAVAVPEKGDVPELLGLAASEGVHSRVCQVLP
mmetsp:Transcript_17667/g.53146  ORF Transcript_17667/g.53146 Transcript_17667/m.53146 type:complete len:224 (-) Transcript_17667:1198-1869(-)